MAKQKRLDSELKQAINFSDLNSLEEGLGIAIRHKWNEVSINDVSEDKIESVKKWVKKKQSRHKDIIINIGSTHIREFVIIFDSIDALEKGLNRAVKENLRKVLIDDVSDEEIEPIEKWIEVNQGKYEDIEIEIGSTYTGLHPDEKEKIRNKVGADVSFFDDAKLHLVENGEKQFFLNWIGSESPQKRIYKIEREINIQQKTYKIKGLAKTEKKKIKLQLEYLKQLLVQNNIEIEIFDELTKQTVKDVYENAHRRRKRWTDKKRLRLIVRVVDKKLFKRMQNKPTRKDVEIEFKQNYKEYNTDNLIKELNLEEDYINYGRGKYGRGNFLEFGEQFYKLVSEARKEFP